MSREEGYITWTNNPQLQDQETGETTPAGKAVQAKAKVRTVAKSEEEPAKKAPKKAEKVEKSSDDRKITLLTKENPKREGSAAWTRFELYRKAKNVEQFYAAGGSSADLRYDEKAGHIQLS